jgi:hypothetical protein
MSKFKAKYRSGGNSYEIQSKPLHPFLNPYFIDLNFQLKKESYRLGRGAYSGQFARALEGTTIGPGGPLSGLFSMQTIEHNKFHPQYKLTIQII